MLPGPVEPGTPEREPPADPMDMTPITRLKGVDSPMACTPLSTARSDGIVGIRLVYLFQIISSFLWFLPSFQFISSFTDNILFSSFIPLLTLYPLLQIVPSFTVSAIYLTYMIFYKITLPFQIMFFLQLLPFLD